MASRMRAGGLRRGGARTGALIGDDLEGAEHVPLIAEEESMPTLEHKESIYQFMIYMPPIGRMKVQHYCTFPVVLAFVLFSTTLLIQASLTAIAGEKIWMDQVDFRHSIVQDWQPQEEGYLGQKMRKIRNLQGIKQIDDGLKQTGEKIRKVKKDYGADWLVTPHMGRKAETACCVGPECYGLPVKCCEANTTTSVAKEGSSFFQFMKPVARKKAKKGEEDSSTDAGRNNAFCKSNHDSLECTPPTSNMIEFWSELDVDGDGQWSMWEAKQDVANLGCRIGVPTEDMFRSACRGILKDAQDTNFSGGVPIHVPVYIEQHQFIPKAYFDWWAGLIRICEATDQNMCHALVAQGIFEALLNTSGKHHGGVRDLDSAVGYCQRILVDNGVCVAALPGTYVMHRSRLDSSCGKTHIVTSKDEYQNPFNKQDAMRVRKVTYSALDQFSSVHAMSFQFLLLMILVIWFTTLMDELNDIITLLDFCWSYPKDDSIPLLTPEMGQHIRRFQSYLNPPQPEDDDQVGVFHRLRSTAALSLSTLSDSVDSIVERGKVSPRGKAGGNGTLAVDSAEAARLPAPKRISGVHCAVLVIMAALRLVILIFMGIIGTSFLIMQHTHLDLLLNAVALAFIFDLDEFMYAFLISEDLKNEAYSMEPFEFTSSLPTTGWRAQVLKRHWWGLAITIIAVFIVWWNDVRNIYPVMEALECACLQTGPRCQSSLTKLDQTWWSDYWSSVSKLSAI